MLILRYIFGFYIQLFPYAFFCCCPFYQHFRIERKKAIICMCSVSVVMCFIFVCFGLAPWKEYNSAKNDFNRNLIFYATLLLLLACYIFLIRAELFQKIFVFFIVMSYGFLIMSSIDFLMRLFPATKDLYFYSPISLSLHVILNIILFYPIYRLMLLIREATASSISPKTWRLLSIVPISFLAIFNLCLQIPLTAEIDSTLILQVFSESTLLYMFLVYIWIFRILGRERVRSEEAVTLKATLENYRHMVENANEIKKMRHEMSHHLQALTLYMREKNYDGANMYLEKVTDEISRMPVLEYTPHALLNSILTEAKARAEQKSITLKYEILVPSQIDMEDIDLCKLLMNLLDNAFSACKYLAPEQRFVTLSIKLKGNFLLFSCQNSYEKERIHYENGNFLSTRDFMTDGEREFHGYGISVMKEISEKYNGAFQITTSDDQFNTVINLCLDHLMTQEDYS